MPLDLEIIDAFHRSGLTQEELARRLGVRQPTVSDWFTRKTEPRGRNLVRLQEELGLAGPAPRTDAATADAEPMPTLQDGYRSSGLGRLFEDMMDWTLYLDVHPAGDGSVTYDEHTKAVIRLPHPLLARFLGVVPPPVVGVLEMTGDAMHPTLEAGDLVVYVPAQTVEGGGLYVLHKDGQLIAQRVQALSGGGYYLIHDNTLQGYRDEMLIPGEKAKDGTRPLINRETGMAVRLHVVGRVIWPHRETDRLHVTQIAELIRGMLGAGVSS